MAVYVNLYGHTTFVAVVLKCIVVLQFLVPSLTLQVVTIAYIIGCLDPLVVLVEVT